MFAINPREKAYVPLPIREPDASTDSDASTSPTSRRCKDRVIRGHYFVISLILEAVILVSLFVVYTRQRHSDQPFESYHQLRAYNQTTLFTENIDLMVKSKEADAFWMKIQETDGIISVPTEWALSQGAQPSLESPEKEGHSIYQIDMFHSLHCLYHIRNRLISKLPLEKWPRDDVHSLHCINFLRQQITCHADVTLQGTDDFLHFAKNDGHQCRDTTAVVQWVTERNWKGHKQYIKDVYGVE